MGPANWLAGYGLTEHPEGGTAVETCRAAAWANVEDSDATLLLGADAGDFAAIVTARACGELRRPILTVPIVRHDAAWRVDKTPAEVADWIVAVGAGWLNVVGQSRDRQVEAFAAEYLVDVFRMLSFGAAE